MQQRSLTLAWAALALVGSFATSMPAYADDDCLSGPKATTPTGQHWYYRIDRTTKKHCWYLADHGAKVNKSATAKNAGPVAGSEDAQATPLEESVADARAELPSTNALSSATAMDAAAPRQAEPQSDAFPSNETTHRLTERDLITQAPTTLTSRLPLPNEFQSAETKPDQNPQTIAVPARSEPSSQPQQVTDAHIGPMQIFLCALAIVLALAAILGRVIFQYVAGLRRKQVPQNRRRQIWPDDTPDGSRQPSYAQMITPERRAHGVRVEQDITEIEQLLRGGSRRLR
ncbi:MAG TPA: hypothetical protein VGC26_05230 [Afipia sp.]